MLALRYLPRTVATSLHPTEGIRLLLEREEVAEDSQHARYAAAIYTVHECYRYTAELSMDGSATLTAEGPACVDHEGTLLKLARSTARAAQRKHGEDLSPWPPRVLRWRGPG